MGSDLPRRGHRQGLFVFLVSRVLTDRECRSFPFIGVGWRLTQTIGFGSTVTLQYQRQVKHFRQTHFFLVQRTKFSCCWQGCAGISPVAIGRDLQCIQIILPPTFLRGTKIRARCFRLSFSAKLHVPCEVKKLPE